jgi:hypothetical protein
MNFKDPIVASFLAVTSALPAFAQEDKEPYAVSHKCAAESMESTFKTPVETMNEEKGVVGLTTAGAATIRMMAEINPDSNILKAIDVEFSSLVPGYDISVRRKLVYDFDKTFYRYLSPIPYEVLENQATEIIERLDAKMRLCMEGTPLSGLSAPSPYKLG